MNAQCLRTKLSTGDATCLGVCMNVGDHCALVWAGGIETECKYKMVRGEMHGHPEENSPGNKGEEQAPRKGDIYSKVEMLASGRREEGLAQRSNGISKATKALNKQYWSGAV